MMIDETNIPRYAMFRGRKVRIFHYDSGSNRPFLIIDTDDSKRSVRREDLTMLPEKKSTPKKRVVRTPMPKYNDLNAIEGIIGWLENDGKQS